MLGERWLLLLADGTSLRGHRVWKTQPVGGLIALGISPVSWMRAFCRPLMSGIAESSARIGMMRAFEDPIAAPICISLPR